MSVFESSLAVTVENLSKANPSLRAFEWFVIGVLFNCPSNKESVEDIVSHVKSIVHLERVSHLTRAEKNELLLRMMEKRIANAVVLQE